MNSNIKSIRQFMNRLIASSHAMLVKTKNLICRRNHHHQLVSILSSSSNLIGKNADAIDTATDTIISLCNRLLSHHDNGAALGESNHGDDGFCYSASMNNDSSCLAVGSVGYSGYVGSSPTGRRCAISHTRSK